MTTPQDVRLTAGQLHAALKTWSLSAAADSPLTGLPRDPADTSSLRPLGLLQETWGAALRTLTSPTGCLRTLIPLPDRITVQSWYKGVDGLGGLVGCWPEPPHMRIRFPATRDDFLRESSALLLADFPAITDSFRAELTVPGLAALAAAVDAVRHDWLEAMLARRCRDSIALARPQLEQAYTDGCRSSDARWLVTLLRLLMPPSVPLPPAVPKEGLAEIAHLGLLQPDGAGWAVTGNLFRLAAWWKTPLPALAHEVATAGPGRPGDYRYLIALRGDGPVWLLEFWQGRPGQAVVTLRSCTGPGYRRALHRLYEPLEAAPCQQPNTASCPHCGVARQAQAKFCAHCGAPLPQEAGHV